MDILERSVDIVFRQFRPERLYNELIHDELVHKSWGAGQISRKLFSEQAISRFPTRSKEEVDCLYDLLGVQTKSICGGDSVVRFIPSYARVLTLPVYVAKQVLCYSGERLYCMYNHVLEWRQFYLHLGQDFYTTAALAYYDLEDGKERNTFLWETTLRTDNAALHDKLKKGIAENHCHLGGTSQFFPIIWAFIMNHPSKSSQAESVVSSNLQYHFSRGAEDNEWSWEQKLKVAAWIRCYLFQRIKHIDHFNRPPIEQLKSDADEMWISLPNAINVLRFLYGLPVPYATATTPLTESEYRVDPKYVLDYALDSSQVHAENHHNRLLAGERSFLYHCFYSIFKGEWDETAADLFYLYLLIKNGFRSEFVQTNKQYGFFNFKQYQDRKEAFFGHHPPYACELTRLAINGNMGDYPLHNMEARVGPSNTHQSFYQKITLIDKAVSFLNKPAYPFFYVIHFIKAPEARLAGKPPNIVPARNAKIRQRAIRQADQMAIAFRNHPYLFKRIAGIDAASIEIGCRPEVFAWPFWKLRYTLPRIQQASGCLHEPVDQAYEFHAAYHAGEDFMDIADGLRAIDEAIRFLPLRRGDRIGHALAMGVDPEVHYNTKHMTSILPNQDYLDNLVWIRYMCMLHNIPLDSQTEQALVFKANYLISYIYGKSMKSLPPMCLEEYFHAWMLRGDPPSWYASGSFDASHTFLPDEEHYREATDPDLLQFRTKKECAQFYYLYHYDAGVRQRGAESATQHIDAKYMELIHALQEYMQQHLSELGISVECNPSSNILIGTFRDYTLHPMYRFFPIESTPTKPMHHLRVTINTDDLGVFDTSLENEYILTAASLRKATRADGKRAYSDEMIEAYLERIRELGFELAFQKQPSAK